MRARVLTSAAQVLLVDLDHELPVNVAEHAAVHPVRNEPAEKEGFPGEILKVLGGWGGFGVVCLDDTIASVPELTECRVRSCSSAVTAAPGSSRCCSYSAPRCTGRTAASHPRGETHSSEPTTPQPATHPTPHEPHLIVSAQPRWLTHCGIADKRGLTTGNTAWPAPKGPSMQHSSDRYLEIKRRL